MLSERSAHGQLLLQVRQHLDLHPSPRGAVGPEECGGTGDNAYCQQLAAEFNAPYPDIFYVCDLIPAGLGKVHWSE
ncbi:hypothetical protein D7X32_09595 [Corallococcus carmarthensis]|uniref:Uncharacterized protein n=1 Tax=Corallococcus carmarthensis TaxID=2316728 RepID=A0A3A8KKT5_9BACT|nr:hypothetical protein D7X32_09595 [Corallococcus carmarthensis]